MIIDGNPGTRRSDSEQTTDITKVGGSDITLGQKIGDESFPVILASDQSLTVTAEGDFTTSSDHDEDTPHVTGDGGAFILGIRNDADTTLVSADGDYIGWSMDASGRGKVTVYDSAGVGLVLDASGNVPTKDEVISDRIRRLSVGDTIDGEEARVDIPADLTSSFIYKGLSDDSTPTSTATWAIMRVSFDANDNPTRVQYRTNVAWDNRADPTLDGEPAW